MKKKACLQFAQEEQIDGVLTAATDYGVLTAAYIAEHMGLPGLNYESAKLIKNKYLVRKKLFENHVDVVVCDGFLGNVVLKTCESFGRHLLRWIQTEISRSPTRVIGALLAQGVFKSIKRGMDPDNVGGAPLLGLNGAVMKSHGSASERAIFNAIRLGVRAANQNINQIIIDEIAMAADALGDAIAAANSRMN